MKNLIISSYFPPRLSEIHPLLYQLSVSQKRLFRSCQNLLQAQKLARRKSSENLPYLWTQHQSLLIRKLGNSDPQLQKNKVNNLTIAHRHIDGILIYPQEIFSLWYLVGNPTAKKGYLPGLQLYNGEVKTAIGGGLCQLSNLLYWMALHTPLVVIERHHHSFDPFPDDRRVLPFGSGAGIAYNYVDLRFYNPTNQAFQIQVWLTEEYLQGAIYSQSEGDFLYQVFERNHRFIQRDGKNYRENEIWRAAIDRKTGNKLQEELLIKNSSEVKYSLESLEAESGN